MLGVEALRMMLLHASVSVDCLHETDHRLVTLRVKVDVVTSSNSLEPTGTVSQGIITYSVLNVVPEITNKSLTIVELNSKSLIVDGTPCAVDRLTITLVLGRALLCFSLVTLKELRSVYRFLWEFKIVFGGEDLHLVRLLMCAHFIGMEKVNSVDLRVQMEIPCSKNIISEAMNWLIGLDYIVEGEIVQEACNCERSLERSFFL